MTPTIKEALGQTRAALERSGVSEASLEADLLLSTALGIGRAGLHASLDDPLPETSQPALQRMLQRRATREPLAYVLGSREFYGLDFKVRPEVFIPRPETELLVEQAIQLVNRRFPGGNALIADVGTGSGAVAVSLAVHLPGSRLFATDASPAALATASANAQAHGVHDRVTCLEGDLLTPLPEPVDLVVANLPYVPTDTIQTLEPEISRFEPAEALDGGPDGLDLVRRLLRQGPGHLRPEAAMLLEMDPEQMDAATAFALSIHSDARIQRFSDRAGSHRMLLIQR